MKLSHNQNHFLLQTNYVRIRTQAPRLNLLHCGLLDHVNNMQQLRVLLLKLVYGY